MEKLWFKLVQTCFDSENMNIVWFEQQKMRKSMGERETHESDGSKRETWKFCMVQTTEN